MPIAEMQARLFFESLNGNVILPKWRAMQDNIRERKEKLQSRYVKSLIVDYIDYMDELARLIDCLPALGKYAISDPTFYQKLLFGANAPYVYRLDGKWEGARNAIMTMEERIYDGMRGVELKENSISTNLDENDLIPATGPTFNERQKRTNIFKQRLSRQFNF
uniref:Flavin-containing monooxygenase n=1 Tax=Meloidogyne incognita TaxID=6306 RepID=A0A914LFN7_MELIC